MSGISEHSDRWAHRKQPKRPNPLVEEGAVYCDTCGHKRSDRTQAGALILRDCPVCGP